jgi:3-phenylpropionate/trans-cinnamate dioxygenase ferredoxin reductase component
MATREVDFLLIGGGIASATAARTLRDEGAEGSITLVGREMDAPYHRPPCSKGYLQGVEDRVSGLLLPAEWWEANDVELLLRTSVLGVDLDERTAKLSNKEQVRFGRALVATGAMVRRLSVDGAGLEGIHYLRTLGNSDSIRADAEQAERVVLVGGSYIASEVAASLTTLGKRCTMVMQEAVTLERTFGPRAGRFFMDILQQRGVEIIGEDEVERFEGVGAGEAGRVRAVVTKGGRELPCDMVVAGVGAMPDVMLARKMGLELGSFGGVTCDAQLATSAPQVWAAGDMAEYESVIHGRTIRIEHEDVAAEQGRTAARNMLGRGVAHETVPYFFSDLADWASLEYVGPAQGWDEEITRGSIEDGSFSQWYLKEGRVLAALSVGRSDDLDPARALIASGASVADSREQLADPASDLAAIAG